MLKPPAGLDAHGSSAFSAGFAQAEDQWRAFMTAALLRLAGGTRGMAACRVDGRCVREPQLSLELALESVATFSAASSDETLLEPAIPPATEILTLLQHLAKTPNYTSIHLKREELAGLLLGIRRLQSEARDILRTLETFGPLRLSNAIDPGPLLTSLCTLKVAAQEILK